MIGAAPLAALAAAVLAAAISPGPAFLMTVRTSVTRGFAAGALLAVGIGIGAGMWAGASLLGLTLLFHVLPGLLTALKLAGAAFLLWLAVKSWRGADLPLQFDQPGATPLSGLAALRLGLATQMANPKPVVFYGAVFAGLVPASLDLSGKLQLVAMVVVIEAGWCVVVARFFSLPAAQLCYARLKSRIDRGFGALMAAFGIKIALG